MLFFVANWKMNGNLDFANRFIEEINAVSTKNTVVICPPTALLTKFSNFRHYIGCQNCFYEKNGAFTGENSPELMRLVGCSYAIIGHSERRSIFCETDDVISKKWNAVVEQQMTPIVCIGETDRNNWKETVMNQLNPFLNRPLQNTIFAYEPIWSIGTGLVPTHEEIDDILGFIKKVIGNKVSLLYGGSVNSKNAKQILNGQNVDGVLVGGASLKIEEFKEIIQM